MPAKSKVLITGATGQVGALVIQYLKADSSVEGERVDEIFDNLPTILGRKPKTMADFAQKNVDSFRY